MSDKKRLDISLPPRISDSPTKKASIKQEEKVVSLKGDEPPLVVTSKPPEERESGAKVKENPHLNQPPLSPSIPHIPPQQPSENSQKQDYANSEGPKEAGSHETKSITHWLMWGENGKPGTDEFSQYKVPLIIFVLIIGLFIFLEFFNSSDNMPPSPEKAVISEEPRSAQEFLLEKTPLSIKSELPEQSESNLTRSAMDFVIKFVESGNTGSGNQLSFYHSQVDYFDFGVIGLDKIQDDLKKYQAAWPERSYEIVAQPTPLNNKWSSWVVSIRYKTQGFTDRMEGTVLNEIELIQTGDGFKISRVKSVSIERQNLALSSSNLDSAFTQHQIVDFVIRFIKSSDLSSPEEETSFYSDQTIYFDNGSVLKDYILRDIIDYRARWPVRSYTVVEKPSVFRSNIVNDLYICYVPITYNVSDGKRTKQGEVLNYIGIKPQQNGYSISFITTKKIK